MYSVYKITNKINGKEYIGLTNNYDRRLKRHWSDLKRGVHENSFLQKEWEQYGADNFFHTLLESEISEENISEKECLWIKIFDTYHNGYNQNEGGNFGPSNGGSQLTKKEIFQILSVVKFQKKPGEVLGSIFGVSRTTISRIRKGVNHLKYKIEFDQLDVEDQKQIFQSCIDEFNIVCRVEESNKLENKRRLTKQQVFEIYVNHEEKILSRTKMAKRIGVKSTNTLICVEKGVTYKNYRNEYNNLNTNEKRFIASLLRNEQK